MERIDPVGGFGSERRHVTVLFADISDSTRLVKGLDPEDAMAILSPVVELMADAVRQHEGTVMKTMGDGILAIFGAPVALEGHAARACLAAIAMQMEINARQEVARHAQLPDINIHIGIATGEVVTGVLGTDPSAAYDAVGFTIHLASYLQDIAPSGTINVSESTYALVKQQLECQPLGPMKIKGVAEPVPVYRLLAKGHETRPRQSGDRTGGPFMLIGRDDELASLERQIEFLLEDEGGRIVSVVGEAGIGKSRLLAAFRTSVVNRGMVWLEGAALSYGRSLGYWPFLEMLRSYSGITAEDTVVDQWRKLSDRVRYLFADDVAEVLPYIASLLGIQVSEEYEDRVRFLDSEAMRRQIFRSMRLLLEKQAQRSPTVLVFEDAFWMDLSSATLLLHLIPLVEHARVLICFVTRGDVESTQWWSAARQYANRYSEVHLGPLSGTASGQLIDSLLKTSDLPPSIRKAILSSAEGNPLFLEEVTRTLVDTDVIVRSGPDGRWQVVGPEDVRLRIPESIHSVIMARVDRLEASARRALKTASVIGRVFYVRVLAQMLDPQVDISANLATLRRADLIFDRRLDPEPECIFKHVLVQEATYDSILLKQRRELHARVAAALERIFVDHLDDIAGLVAYHYARAEIWEKAHEFLLKAGDQAERIAADAEALQHFQGAMQAFERAYGRKEGPVEQAIIQRKIGEALYRRGLNDEAARQFRVALRLLGDRDPESNLGIHLEIVRQLLIQLWHRLLPNRIMDKRIGTASVANEERVRIFMMQWWQNYFEHPLRTVLYSLKTINVSERHGILVGMVHSSATLGFVCDALGAPSIGRHYHVRSERLAATTGNPLLMGHAAIGFGWYASYVGDWNAAEDHFSRAAMLFWQAGDLRHWGSVTWGRILLLYYKGMLANAIQLTRDFMRSSEDSSDAVNIRWSRLADGMLLLRVGYLSKAETSLGAAIQEGLEASDWQIWTRATAELALVRLQQKREDDAMSIITSASATVKERGLVGHQVTTMRNAYAEALLTMMERGGKAEITRLRAEAKRACKVAVRGGGLFRGSLPQALRLQGTYRWFMQDTDKAKVLWDRSLSVSRELGADYDTGVTYLEIGRRLGIAEDVARGEAMLAEMRRDL